MQGTSYPQPVRLLSERQVCQRLGLTRQQFVDLTELDDTFPNEVELVGDFWGWIEHEIDDYIDLKIWHRDYRSAMHERKLEEQELNAATNMAQSAG